MAESGADGERHELWELDRHHSIEERCLAPAGARNCLQHAHVRMLRGVLRLGGVRVDLSAIGAQVAYVRFGVLSATCCTRHRGRRRLKHLEAVTRHRPFASWRASRSTPRDGPPKGLRVAAALVHNSRSRSIIALHPEIRGPA